MLECAGHDSEARTRLALEELLHAADRTSGVDGTGGFAASPGGAG